MKVKALVPVALACWLVASFCHATDPVPKPWPPQFHAQLIQNTSEGHVSITELWYDWVNGRSYNIIQRKLGEKIWDLEWTNGTSFYFDLEHETCTVRHFPVGLLRPNFLNDSHYVGVQSFDGLTCNVWEKVDFITYFEDVESRRPAGWIFYTGMSQRVVTFEVGAVLSDPYWQAPSFCFTEASEGLSSTSSVSLVSQVKAELLLEPSKRWPVSPNELGSLLVS